MSRAPSAPAAGPLAGRSLALFFNFFLVILAYYQVKAASRSLLLEFGGTNSFPYVWIGSAIVLLGFIGIYNHLVARFSRVQVVVGSLLAFSALLCLFRWRLVHGGIPTVVTFYIFVDIFSVVIVEQFWSLANNITRLDEGKRSYWFVGSGGLVGGVVGGVVASNLLVYTPMRTADLLLSCAALLLVTAVLNLAMGRKGMFTEVADGESIALHGEGLKAVLNNRYLLLIALVVCLSQLAEPVVEYQFLHAISSAYAETDERTRFIANFFAVMGFVSIAVNLLLTPLIHRGLGIIAGLAMQPLLLGAATMGFALQPGLLSACVMKISDRGLSYSINRASKELLYVPIDPLLTFQAKAWIDMLGYRLFKVLGSGMIVFVTVNAPPPRVVSDLTWLTFTICGAWLIAVYALAQEQQRTLIAVRA
jgi:AAA family ATP:ADP antiporter